MEKEKERMHKTLGGGAVARDGGMGGGPLTPGGGPYSEGCVGVNPGGTACFSLPGTPGSSGIS